MNLKIEGITFDERGEIIELKLHEGGLSLSGSDVSAFIAEYQKAQMVNRFELRAFREGMDAAKPQQ